MGRILSASCLDHIRRGLRRENLGYSLDQHKDEIQNCIVAPISFAQNFQKIGHTKEANWLQTRWPSQSLEVFELFSLKDYLYAWKQKLLKLSCKGQETCFSYCSTYIKKTSWNRKLLAFWLLRTLSVWFFKNVLTKTKVQHRARSLKSSQI